MSISVDDLLKILHNRKNEESNYTSNPPNHYGQRGSSQRYPPQSNHQYYNINIPTIEESIRHHEYHQPPTLSSQNGYYNEGVSARSDYSEAYSKPRQLPLQPLTLPPAYDNNYSQYTQPLKEGYNNICEEGPDVLPWVRTSDNTSYNHRTQHSPVDFLSTTGLFDDSAANNHLHESHQGYSASSAPSDAMHHQGLTPMEALQQVQALQHKALILKQQLSEYLIMPPPPHPELVLHDSPVPHQQQPSSSSPVHQLSQQQYVLPENLLSMREKDRGTPTVCQPTMIATSPMTTSHSCPADQGLSASEAQVAADEAALKARTSRSCSVPGCRNRVVQGGRCIAHGARRKLCAHPGCFKNVKMAGLCSAHGPARKRCEVAGCIKVSVQGGRCISHGARKKSCRLEGCVKQAIIGGMCKRHYDEVNGVVKVRARRGTERRALSKLKAANDDSGSLNVHDGHEANDI